VNSANGPIEVAGPDSVPNLVWCHWVQLLYLFELLMVALGTLLRRAAVQQLGLAAFGVTAAFLLTTRWLGDQLFTDARRPIRWIEKIEDSRWRRRTVLASRLNIRRHPVMRSI
jgi:hypothetical protein